MAMQEQDKKRVSDCVYEEGFSYAFVSLSDFADVKDEEFHRLRRAYLAAHSDLAEYIGVKPGIANG